jgi:hypothetical protein
MSCVQSVTNVQSELATTAQQWRDGQVIVQNELNREMQRRMLDWSEDKAVIRCKKQAHKTNTDNYKDQVLQKRRKSLSLTSLNSCLRAISGRRNASRGSVNRVADTVGQWKANQDTLRKQWSNTKILLHYTGWGIKISHILIRYKKWKKISRTKLNIFLKSTLK